MRTDCAGGSACSVGIHGKGWRCCGGRSTCICPSAAQFCESSNSRSRGWCPAKEICAAATGYFNWFFGAAGLVQQRASVRACFGLVQVVKAMDCKSHGRSHFFAPIIIALGLFWIGWVLGAHQNHWSRQKSETSADFHLSFCLFAGPGMARERV